MIFGGSWGSTLGLAYAQTYPKVVIELILRGIFLGCKKEISYLCQYGACEVFPDKCEDYIKPIDEDTKKRFYISILLILLTDSDEELKQQAAKAWSIWDASTSKLYVDEKSIARYGEDNFSLAFARI